MLTYPQIDPIIFSIGPLAIRWYGLMYVIGFLLAWWLARKRCVRPDSPVTPEDVDDLVFNAMLGVIVDRAEFGDLRQRQAGKIAQVDQLPQGWVDLFEVLQGAIKIE
jgi:hypothetical protein